MKTRKQALVFFTLVLFALSGVHAQQDVSFETQKVAENVYCLYGSGGNIGILSTDEGLLIVDSQFESVADSVLKKIGEISSKPIRYLVNTHYHGDHTGGNEIIGKGAEVIMHPDCRATKQHALDQAGVKSDVMERAEDWEEGMVLQLGDETVHLLHFGDAHTSGDIVLVFEDSKVVHTVDLFFHGRQPYIDVEDGADTENWIRAIETLCERYPDYRYIPGHGRVTDAKSYMLFAEYLRKLREEVSEAIRQGQSKVETVDQVEIDAKTYFPGAGSDVDERIERNVGWVYDEMMKRSK